VANAGLAGHFWPANSLKMAGQSFAAMFLYKIWSDRVFPHKTVCYWPAKVSKANFLAGQDFCT
jgi:hypothetical protein